MTSGVHLWTFGWPFSSGRTMTVLRDASDGSSSKKLNGLRKNPTAFPGVAVLGMSSEWGMWRNPTVTQATKSCKKIHDVFTYTLQDKHSESLNLEKYLVLSYNHLLKVMKYKWYYNGWFGWNCRDLYMRRIAFVASLWHHFLLLLYYDIWTHINLIYFYRLSGAFKLQALY